VRLPLIHYNILPEKSKVVRLHNESLLISVNIWMYIFLNKTVILLCKKLTYCKIVLYFISKYYKVLSASVGLGVFFYLFAENSREVIFMGVSTFKKSKGLQEQIDIQEAFNIWNSLRVWYHSKETVQFMNNFVQDHDFDLLLGKWQGSIEKYEKLAEKLQLKVPKNPPEDFKTSMRINELRDDLIYRRVYHDLTAELFFLTNAYRSSTTNDNVRQVIRHDLTSHLNDFELLYKYGKLKGWHDEPPAYKTAKPVKNESLAVSEAFHILDHIGQRYHQLQLTFCQVYWEHWLCIPSVLLCIFSGYHGRFILFH